MAALLLAAACSNGSDDAGRGAVPTTAPAVTATSATDAVAPATTLTTANVTDVPDDSTTPVATVTVTDTTPTGTTTPVTVGDTTPPVTGTTEPVTSTTGSGPTVPTTLPVTDDTTTSTTEADTGDGTEPRNKVDEQYPLGSAERQAYLAVSGGVAPVGATVTFDAGDAEFPIGHGQRGRTTADRWPNGYPAAPRSPDYSATTFAQREAQRAARWVAAMERGGMYRWWVGWVPDTPDEPFLLWYNREPAPSELHALREYQTPERYNDLPPADLIWAYPRLAICSSVAATKAAKHAGTGSETLPCEVVTDWALWLVEEFTHPSVINLPWYDRLYTVFHRESSLLMQALPQPPTHPHAVSVAVAGAEALLVYSGGVQAVLEWVHPPADYHDYGRARYDVEKHFMAAVQAGRKPWETVP